VLRKALLFLLREDESAVRDDVELTLRARQRLRLVLGRPVDLGGETRSPFVVPVSDGAVVDLDPHVGTLVALGDAGQRGEKCA
jgi:hypothetical protein